VFTSPNIPGGLGGFLLKALVKESEENESDVTSDIFPEKRPVFRLHNSCGFGKVARQRIAKIERRLADISF